MDPPTLEAVRSAKPHERKAPRQCGSLGSALHSQTSINERAGKPQDTGSEDAGDPKPAPTTEPYHSSTRPEFDTIVEARRIERKVSHSAHALCLKSKLIVGVDYWYSQRIPASNDNNGGTLSSIMRDFRSFLESPEFLAACENGGLVGPNFTWKDPHETLITRFTEEALLPSPARPLTLSVVFHGTSAANIDSILSHGLDPRRRRRQAHGPGEYFGKDPGTSVSFCNGGLRMLVFCVVAPESYLLCEGACTDDSSAYKPTGLQRSTRSPPNEFCVVEENHHQVPLGVLSFTSVKAATLSRSRTLRRQLRGLRLEVQRQNLLAHEAKLKATIIQLMIQGETDLAAYKFNKTPDGFFSHAAKQEIAFYAYQRMDEQFVEYFFKGRLPSHADCLWDELEGKIKSVETHESEAAAALKKLEESKAKLLADSSRKGTGCRRNRLTLLKLIIVLAYCLCPTPNFFKVMLIYVWVLKSLRDCEWFHEK